MVINPKWKKTLLKHWWLSANAGAAPVLWRCGRHHLFSQSRASLNSCWESLGSTDLVDVEHTHPHTSTQSCTCSLVGYGNRPVRSRCVYSVCFPFWMRPSHGTLNGFPFPRAALIQVMPGERAAECHYHRGPRSPWNSVPGCREDPRRPKRGKMKRKALIWRHLKPDYYIILHLHLSQPKGQFFSLFALCCPPAVLV